MNEEEAILIVMATVASVPAVTVVVVVIASPSSSLAYVYSYSYSYNLYKSKPGTESRKKCACVWVWSADGEPSMISWSPWTEDTHTHTLQYSHTKEMVWWFYMCLIVLVAYVV